MPFTSTSLSVVAYANGFTLWNYQTEDTLEEVKSHGYFNNIQAFARAGDRIMITSLQKGEAENDDIYVNKINNGEVFTKETGIIGVQKINSEFIEEVLQKISDLEIGDKNTTDEQTADIKATAEQAQKSTNNEPLDVA